MTVVNHSDEISNDSFIGLVCNLIHEVIQVTLLPVGFVGVNILVISFHIETEESSARSFLDLVLLQLMKLVTDFWVFIKKANLTVADLKETNLEANLPDS